MKRHGISLIFKRVGLVLCLYFFVACSARSVDYQLGVHYMYPDNGKRLINGMTPDILYLARTRYGGVYYMEGVRPHITIDKYSMLDRDDLDLWAAYIGQTFYFKTDIGGYQKTFSFKVQLAADGMPEPVLISSSFFQYQDKTIKPAWCIGDSECAYHPFNSARLGFNAAGDLILGNYTEDPFVVPGTENFRKMYYPVGDLGLEQFDAYALVQPADYINVSVYYAFRPPMPACPEKSCTIKWAAVQNCELGVHQYRISAQPVSGWPNGGRLIGEWKQMENGTNKEWYQEFEVCPNDMMLPQDVIWIVEIKKTVGDNLVQILETTLASETWDCEMDQNYTHIGGVADCDLWAEPPEEKLDLKPEGGDWGDFESPHFDAQGNMPGSEDQNIDQPEAPENDVESPHAPYIGGEIEGNSGADAMTQGEFIDAMRSLDQEAFDAVGTFEAPAPTEMEVYAEEAVKLERDNTLHLAQGAKNFMAVLDQLGNKSPITVEMSSLGKLNSWVWTVGNYHISLSLDKHASLIAAIRAFMHSVIMVIFVFYSSRVIISAFRE